MLAAATQLFIIACIRKLGARAHPVFCMTPQMANGLRVTVLFQENAVSVYDRLPHNINLGVKRAELSQKKFT
jgi:hypothetical protein